MTKKDACKRELCHILLTVLASAISVLALHVLVLPSNFASTGIDGLCTVLYKVTGINMGWFKIAINTPLLALAFFFLNKKYVWYVLLFTGLDSVGVLLLDKLNFYTYIPVGLPDSSLIGYRFLAALVSGVLLGVCVGIMVKIGYSSGGVDVIASLIHKWKPHFNVEKLISICSYAIVGISFFVYRDLTSVFLSATQIFVLERIVFSLLKRERFAVEVKIVTKDPNIIKHDILYTHDHSATIVKSNGMYSGENNYVILCVMPLKEIPPLMNTLKQYPDTFVYFLDGARIQGDFHFKKGEVGRWIAAFK